MSGDRLAGFVWFIGLGVLIGYDIIALIVKSPQVPTLTSFAIRRVPADVAIAFFAWLLIHFAIRYWWK